MNRIIKPFFSISFIAAVQAFSPQPLPSPISFSSHAYKYKNTNNFQLNAIQKSQTAIYDGAEFVSILSYLITESNSRICIDDNDGNTSDDDDTTNTNNNTNGRVRIKNNKLPSTKAGYLQFVTGTLPNSSDRIIAVPLSLSSHVNDDNNDINDDNNDEVTFMEDGVLVYTDSIAIIPKGINDADAISTASAALCGVHCGMPANQNRNGHGHAHGHNDGDRDGDGSTDDNSNDNAGNTVILGGGDYACFTAKALSAFGIDVNLVTTRPMALKDTPLNPLRGSKINAMSPNIINDENYIEETIGFSEAIGKFDTCIDTIGDEAKMSKIISIQDGINRFCGDVGVIAKLRVENQCKSYISTVTRSQRFVLEEGILFARDLVLKYQKDLESDQELIDTATIASTASTSSPTLTTDNNYQILVPPRNYGKTIQTLFDKNIIYPTEWNENGNHKGKKAFVRGCSFPDYAENEIWPQDSTDGAAVRFGFPGISELTLEARMEKMMGAFDDTQSTSSSSLSSSSSGGTGTVSGNGNDGGEDAVRLKKKKKKQSNPFIVEIESLGDIMDEIRSQKKDAVLFVSAPYCRLCRSIGPIYNRMARISNEELKSDLQFAKATTGTSKAMKQLTFTLQIDSVPTFILFRKGEKYGEPLGVPKLPSVKLNRAIEGLKTGKDWDPEILDIEEGMSKMRTKI